MQYNLQLSQESIGDGPEYAGFFSKTQFVDFVLIITTLPTLSVIMIYIHSGSMTNALIAVAQVKYKNLL